MCASSNGHAAVVMLLLLANANVNLQDQVKVPVCHEFVNFSFSRCYLSVSAWLSDTSIAKYLCLNLFCVATMYILHGSWDLLR